MRPTRIIVAGGREFKDYDLLEREVKRFIVEDLRITNLKEVEIISGMARGADRMGKQFAEKYGIALHEEPVLKEEWDKYGRAAGHYRNERMAERATAAIVFWNGVKERSGSWDMITQARGRNLVTKVIETPY
jgi:hypothetical protein